MDNNLFIWVCIHILMGLVGIHLFGPHKKIINKLHIPIVIPMGIDSLQYYGLIFNK